VVEDVDPQTAMGFSEMFEGSGQLLVPENSSLLEAVVLNERLYWHVRANLSRRLIGYPEQIQKDVLEIDDGDHHSRVYVFHQDTVDLLQDHCQHDV
jgi:hypothetical protein